MARKDLERVADLSGLLEEPEFLGAFCAGCRARPREPWAGCAADGDPESEYCVRRRVWAEIQDALEGARQDIAMALEDAGCWA